MNTLLTLLAFLPLIANARIKEVTCIAFAGGYVPAAIGTEKGIGQAISLEDCSAAVDASAGGVVCSKTGGGLGAGRDFRPTNIRSALALGRYAESLPHCLEASRAAAGQTVCTFTGIDWKPTNIETGNWFGSSSKQSYCVQASARAHDGKVCAWFGDSGGGEGSSWYLTDIRTGSSLSSGQSLSSCLALN